MRVMASFRPSVLARAHNAKAWGCLRLVDKVESETGNQIYTVCLRCLHHRNNNNDTVPRRGPYNNGSASVSNFSHRSTSVGRNYLIKSERLGTLSSKLPLSLWTSSKQTEWNKAVSEAEKIVGYPTSFMSLRCLLSDEIANVAMQMRKLVGTKHPLLKTARGLIHDGKFSMQARGLIVLLISKAAGPGNKDGEIQDKVNGIYPSQRALAEITEMIHTANLIHKGVVNLAELQPCDGPLKDMEFGNKIAVLSGDFLLANACTGLAGLHNTHVVESVSSAISELMEAEFTGFKDKHGNAMLTPDIKFSDWQHQTYLSSGSLLAKSCQSALQLANHSQELQQQAFEFGLNMAYAQQLHDDLKPFLKPDETETPPSLLSAPVICHIDRCRQDKTLSSFLPSHPDSLDPKKAFSTVQGGSSVEYCKDLCMEYGEKATQALGLFRQSEAKSALVNIITAVTKL